MKLRWRTPNARHDPAASIEVVDDSIKDILIAIRVGVVLVKMSRLSASEVIAWMSATNETKR